MEMHRYTQVCLDAFSHKQLVETHQGAICWRDTEWLTIKSGIQFTGIKYTSFIPFFFFGGGGGGGGMAILENGYRKT